MRLRLGAAFASALTITFGGIVVLGLLITDEFGLSAGFVSGTRDATDILLQLVTITVGLLVLLGVVNLLLVHLRRLFGRKKGALYSAVLVASFAAVVGTYIADKNDSLILLETVLVSVESALAGLLFFTLVYGAARMMRRDVTWTGILFVTALLVVLVGALPFPGVRVVRDIREWLLEIPVSAGARGILLGIALATLVTGIRVLVGIDKSYRE